MADKPRRAWSDEIGNCWRFSYYYGAKGSYTNFPTFQACPRLLRDRKKP